LGPISGLGLYKLSKKTFPTLGLYIFKGWLKQDSDLFRVRFWPGSLNIVNTNHPIKIKHFHMLSTKSLYYITEITI
jgi:hypothetical protein